jgi:hypothetical protein
LIVITFGIYSFLGWASALSLEVGEHFMGGSGSPVGVP